MGGFYLWIRDKYIPNYRTISLTLLLNESGLLHVISYLPISHIFYYHI